MKVETLRKYENIIDRIKGWYVVVFVSFLLLSRMVAFVELVTNRINGACYIVGAAVGGILCVAELLLHYRRYLKKEYYLLAFFVFVCLISSFLFRSYGIADNIKNLVWTVLELFLFTSLIPFGGEENTSSVAVGKLALKRMADSLIAIQFVAVTISVAQFFLQSSYIVPDYNGTYDRRQGFCEERLFGIFTDPNYAAVASLLVILAALTLMYCRRTRRELKIWYIVTVVMNMIYIALSGSRTARVALIVVLPAWGYFRWRTVRIREGKNWHLSGALVAAGIVAVSILYLSCSGMVFSATADVTVNIRPYVGLSPYEEGEEVSLVRKDTGEDISNSRMAIWGSAITLWKDHPVFGLSPKNMPSYAKRTHPDSYIAKRGYQAHNGFVALLVGSGLIGTLPIVILFVLFLKELYFYLKKIRGREISEGMLLCLLVMMTVGISSLFLLEIFFAITVTVTTILFWISAGCAYWYLRSFHRK